MPDSSRDAAQPRLVRIAGRDVWHVYWQRRRISTGCADRAEAQTFLARFVADLSAPTPAAPLLVGDILSRYLADRVDAEKPGAERLRWAHKPLTRILGSLVPEQITEAACRAYVRDRADRATKGTARTELQALRAALKWAAGRGLIQSAPAIVLPSRPAPRERWLLRDEAALLVTACRAPHVRLFVLLALHTGARAGAILGLAWDRVRLDQKTIDFREPGMAQTRKRRVPVPINDTLLPELVAAHAGRTCEWVVEWAGVRVASIKHGFRDAAARAGLPGITPHVLRHTAATWMAQDGVPLWEIAGMLGHSSPTMIEQHYGHHSPDHLRRAAKALG